MHFQIVKSYFSTLFTTIFHSKHCMDDMFTAIFCSKCKETGTSSLLCMGILQTYNGFLLFMCFIFLIIHVFVFLKIKRYLLLISGDAKKKSARLILIATQISVSDMRDSLLILYNLTNVSVMMSRGSFTPVERRWLPLLAFKSSAENG